MRTALPSRLTFITGASRGMGEAIARHCLQAGHQVIGLSRRRSEALEALAAPGQLAQWPVDLADPQPVAQRLHDWLRTQAPDRWQAVDLINNAGVIAPLRDLSDSAWADSSQALRVGLEAPVLLASAFLAGTQDWSAERRLLNISSGLGRRAMAGSATYCAAKAGLDHVSRCLALEEAAKPNGARVVSLAPGVIDTDMQRQLRGADPATFADRERFVQLHQQHQLMSPDDAAAKVMACLLRDDFGRQPVADVRDPQ